MKKRKTVRLLIGLLVMMALVILAGCGATKSGTQEKAQSTTGMTTYPITIKDDLGNSVIIEKEPEKIISLSPANTETLFALGLSDKIVGRTDYCNYPEEVSQITSIGDFNMPNIEKIISLSPDLILASNLVNDDVRKQVEATGTKVVVYDPTSIEGVVNTMITTGQITNRNDKAKALTDSMNEKRQAIIDKAAKENPQKSVFIDVGDYYSAGAGSLLGSLLEDINTKNIAVDTGMVWPVLSVEKIISGNPDVYISLFTPIEAIKKVPGFDQINAVKNDKIVFYEMLSPNSDLIQRPGPRIVEGLELLSKDVYQ